MARALTSNITTYKDSTAYRPAVVIEVRNDSSVLGRWCTYVQTWDDWDGASNDALGLIASIGDITNEVDWRGGLGFYGSLSFTLIDDSAGTLLAALAGSELYDVFVYFGFVSTAEALPAKSTDCILIYRGAVDNYEAGWGYVTITTADIRERRYKQNILTLCEVSNEANYCGYQRDRTSDSGWDTAAFTFVDSNIPDRSRGKLIPVCFGSVTKARGLLVSKWPGADDLTDAAGYLTRGPLWVFSDMRFIYGDANAQDYTDEIFHYDAARNTYNPLCLIDTNNINSLHKGYLDNDYEKLIACLRPEEGEDNNALNAAGAGSFLFRVEPRTHDEIDSNLVNNPRVLFDWQGNSTTELYHGLSRAHPYAPGTLPYIWARSKMIDVPAAGLIRAAFFEVNIESVAGTIGSPTTFSIRLRRGTIWGGSSESSYSSWRTLLSSTVSKFNNWADSAGKNKDWVDGEVLISGSNPFGVGAIIGPRPISDLRDKDLILGIDNAEATIQATVRFFGARLIAAADVPIEDINMVADIDRSFDDYVVGPSHECGESIYATLYELMDVPLADMASLSEWAGPSGTIHAGRRLDFQLQDDVTGQELLDRMATQSLLWLICDETGDERPVFRVRDRDAVTTPSTAALSQATVKDGSLRVRRGELEDLYNAFRVRYFKNNVTGDFTREYWVNKDGGNLGGTEQTTVEGWCDDSVTKYGFERELLYEADMIEDDATALSLLLSLASRHVDRPRVLSLTTWLNAIGMEPGDQPAIDHPLFERIALKHSVTLTAGVVFSASADAVITFPASIDGKGIVKADWVYLTSGGLVSAGLAGWYRCTTLPYGTSTEKLDIYARDASARSFSNVTVKILPVMEVRRTTLRASGGWEIDLELVELVQNPEL